MIWPRTPKSSNTPSRRRAFSSRNSLLNSGNRPTFFGSDKRSSDGNSNRLCLGAFDFGAIFDFVTDLIGAVGIGSSRSASIANAASSSTSGSNAAKLSSSAMSSSVESSSSICGFFKLSGANRLRTSPVVLSSATRRFFVGAAVFAFSVVHDLNQDAHKTVRGSVFAFLICGTDFFQEPTN